MENLPTENTNAISYLSCLQRDDVLYCDRIFTDYAIRLHFLKSLSDCVDLDFKKLTEEMPHSVYFDKATDKVEQASDALKESIEVLTVELCTEIEEYFSRQYSITFKSLQPQQGKKLEPLVTCQPLIDNIKNQIGADFTSAGKTRITQAFQKLFHSTDRQPVLKGNKIYFPDLISYRSHSDTLAHLYDETAITATLAAISLQIFGCTHLPDTTDAKLMHFLRVVETSVWHDISYDPKISLWFYKNGKLEVQFPNPTAASNFFNTYELATIVQINSKKNK